MKMHSRITRSALPAVMWLMVTGGLVSGEERNLPKDSGQFNNAQQLGQVVRSAKIGMAEAIRIAEEQTKGKAVNVALTGCEGLKSRATADKFKSMHDEHPIYEVTVLANDRFSSVLVCGETSQVLDKQDVGTQLQAGRGAIPTGSSFGGDTRGWSSAQDDRGFQPATRWQKSSDLIGKSVTNAQDENLGKIENLAIDPQAGRIIYGVLSFGGFMGMGDKLFAVPWSSLALSADSKEFVLNVDKDRLKKASGFNQDAWPNFGDERWATETHTFYGQRPYWKSEYRTDPSNDPLHRWYQPTRSWQKATDLTGKGAKSAQNREQLGELDELIIDPDSGRLVYGVLDYKTKKYAIPWSLWEMSPGYEDMMVSATSEKLKNSTFGFEKDYPNLTEPRLLRDTHKYYGVSPYWELSSSR